MWIRSLRTTSEPLIWESNSLLKVIWVIAYIFRRYTKSCVTSYRILDKVCIMLLIQSFASTLLLMPIGQLVLILVVPSLVTAFILGHLSLPGSLRGNRLLAEAAMRLNTGVALATCELLWLAQLLGFQGSGHYSCEVVLW